MTSRIESPTAKPAPPLSLITSAPLPRVRVRSASATVAFQPGILLERQPGGLRRRPDRHHAVAVLAQDQGRDLRGRQLERLGDQAAKPGRVELRSQADDLARRASSSRRTARYVKTSTGLETTSTIASRLQAGRGHLAEDAQEQLDVAIDQVEPALVGLAAQAGGDDDDVALGNRLVAGRADPLIGDQRGAVEQVEGLALAPGRRSGRSGRSG